MTSGPPENAAAVAAMSTSMHGLIERVQDLVFPPAINLVVETVETEPEADEPDRSIGFYFLPGIVLMALMFAAQGLSAGQIVGPWGLLAGCSFAKSGA